MVAINSRGGHWSYRRDYKPTDTVKTYHHCSQRGRSWYSSDGFGFLSCPYCEGNMDISTRIDQTGGNMGLQAFPGAQYSARPTISNSSNSNGAQQTIDRVVCSAM